MKKHPTRLIALLMSLVLIFGLAACGGATTSPSPSPTATTAAPTPTPTATPTATPSAAPTTLVSGYNQFNGKFSPFFASTAYDQDVGGYFTQISLLETDRSGAPILNGMNGTDITYNGTSYHYDTPANIDVVQNDDGTTDYNITLRQDLKFSDGTPVTIDDVIFSMYVMADPSYDGLSVFSSLPIVGMNAYRTGVDDAIFTQYQTLGNNIFAAGPDNTDFTNWTQDQQTAFWTTYFTAGGLKMVDEIVGYCQANMSSLPTTSADVFGNDIALAMANWGYGTLDSNGVLTGPYTNTTWDLKNGTFPTAQDFWNEILANPDYGPNGLGFSNGDLALDAEAANDGIQTLMVNAFISGEGPKDPAAGGTINNIAGIKKTGDYTCTVTTSSFDATTIYNLGFSIAPLNYYGDPSQYNYANNQFGFTKGDLSGVHAKDSTPQGAGPYVFQSYQNGVVTLQANPLYYQGAPQITYVRLQETQSADMISGLTSGTFDLVNPSYSQSDVDAIKAANSNGALTGDVLTTYAVDNLGYGYIGINAQKVNVGGDAGSDASKDLRRGFATLFAVYRDTVINSYYGDRATVIQYSISNTSWAAPQPSDDGYSVAFSVDVNGNPIYTDSMSETDKEAAALQAAIGFFQAAGYTWDATSNKFTAAPAGASMSYEVQIPGGGTGDHPDYGILTAARDALASVGITLQITDLTDSTSMFNAMSAGTIEMWCAAWQATADPDMYQIYATVNIPGNGGTNSNSYGLADSQLDQLMMQARQSADQSFRKATYFQCLNIIRDWAVEIPCYQRQNAYVVSTERVNISSIPDMSTFWDWRSDVWTISMN